MIVTTTNSIEGREISRYNDPIAANVVIGTNIFNDIGASYVDFFGGRSTNSGGALLNLNRLKD
jgi:Uncharacterized conserved protein